MIIMKNINFDLGSDLDETAVDDLVTKSTPQSTVISAKWGMNTFKRLQKSGKTIIYF